ncbi:MULTISPECIES: DNA alkylation repair protein [unclassified Streptomyces]|uniref:DNA alkylation repair protein n=1 Tax=unclassified Streptomyces TaxID=2593676 RepID=UPI001F036849|nr:MULTISPECIES: DNA alkylation repair protein [unclassified Streptomyces]MCH0562555.1 DNA alkylation repair protein [Streptomyces sp. MUM 2J]MCH0572613.1 DNA alkylation repair protein [Streptomyces sp. MUM 136J]
MNAPDTDPAEVPRSALADTVLTRLTAAYGAAADPERAAAMRAYMKDTVPFLGIPAPARRALSRAVLAGTARPDETDCRAVALRCWALPEREYHYFAADYLRRHAGRCSSSFLPVVRHLLTTVSWWDTVDTLAVHVVGPLVAADRSLAPVMDTWAAADDPWLVRAALLHQLRYRERTDAERLFAHCLSSAGHRDFFVRKAIGWALREYARTDPQAVHDLLAREGGRFAPLTVREALKHAGG